jgi:hypothetical protein
MGFFDGFWGLSSRGKEAQNNLAGMRNQYQGQFDQWLGRSGDSWNRGNDLFNWSSNYWRDRANTGAPSVEDIRRTGEAIMPYQTELNRIRQRNLDAGEDFRNSVGSWENLSPWMTNNLNLQQQNINNNSDYIRDQIDSTHGSTTGRERETSANVLGNITRSFDDARDIIGGAYGRARTDNDKTYNDILSRTGNAFGAMRRDLEQIKPGSQAQQAQVSRSFAPNIANAAGRLRRAGVGADSLQGSNIIGNAEVARARAMDDRAAASTGQYVDSMTRLRSGELGATTDALTSRLNNSMNLGTTEAGLQSNLSLGRGSATSQEQIRSGDSLNNMDYLRLGGNTQNSNNTTNLLNQNVRDRMNNDLLGRQIQMEDFRTREGLRGDANNIDLTGINLGNQQWQQGMNWQNWDRSSRDNAANQMGNLMQGQYNNSFNGANTANQFGQVPLQMWNQQLQQEQANSGWGKRLLGGLAGSALSYFTGGFGNALGRAGGKLGGMLGNALGGGRNPQGGGFNVSNSRYTGSPMIPSNNLFGGTNFGPPMSTRF